MEGKGLGRGHISLQSHGSEYAARSHLLNILPLSVKFADFLRSLQKFKLQFHDPLSPSYGSPQKL